MQNGRWQCRRPASLGGPCEDGPSPDGACCRQLPPCAPRLTHRTRRWQLSVIAFGIVAALIGAFAGTSGGVATRIALVDPGPLTGAHHEFAGKRGCGACHAGHEMGVGGWLSAVFTGTDMTGRCLDCHTFGGHEREPHNSAEIFVKAGIETNCAMCHTEHRGENANIAGLNDDQCVSCHYKRFARFGGKHPSFETNHPPFDSKYPHFTRTAIRFDHASHLGKHFADQRFSSRAPTGCVGCHEVAEARREVRPLGFETACAECHADQIAAREFTLLRLPELLEPAAEREAVREACGPTLEEFEAAADGEKLEPEEFESVSIDTLNPVAAYVLGVDPEDPDSYDPRFRELVEAVIEDGTAALLDAVGRRADNDEIAGLFAGLSPEALKRVACAWAANVEYELPSDAAFGGWYGDFTELRYRPSGHADPVVRRWVEFAVAAAARAEDADDRDRAVAMRESLLSAKDGPGNCIKCHSVNRVPGGADDDLDIGWSYGRAGDRPHHLYSHGAHLRLVGAGGVSLSDPERGCATCHRIDTAANYAAGFETVDPASFSSNFFPITKTTCVQCHAEERVRQDCQLCHRYHRESGFTARVTKHDD
jgi:mono/diheme cytochrome c family protein